MQPFGLSGYASLDGLCGIVMHPVSDLCAGGCMKPEDWLGD